MKVSTVKKALNSIEKLGDAGPGHIYRNDAAMHRLQDALYLKVLRVIASGKAKNHRALASAAVKAADIKFARWYA